MVATTNIPGLPIGLALSGSEIFPAIQNGVDRRFTISQIATFFNTSAAAALQFQAPLQRNASIVSLGGFTAQADNGVMYRASSALVGVTAAGVVGALLMGGGAAAPPSYSIAGTTGQILVGNTTAAISWVSAGTTGQLFAGVTGGQPTFIPAGVSAQILVATSGQPVWSSTVPGLAGVDTFSAGVTGLTPASPTTGNVVLGGVLLTGSGGTGVTGASTGSVGVVLSTQPSILSAQLTTPAIGVATGTSLSLTGGEITFNATAPPAGGATGTGVRFSSTTNFGLFFGSGAPTLSAAQGSLFENNAATVSSAVYYNTSGGNAWNTLLATGGPLGTPGSGNLVNTSGYSAAAVVGLVNQSVLVPTTQNLTSGSGATYTPTAGAVWIKARMVGGGGGGGGTGASTSPTGGTGGVTIFNGISAAAGLGGVGASGGTSVSSGGAGGTGGAGTATLRKPGNGGGAGSSSGSSGSVPAGQGGGTQFGGAPAILGGASGANGVAGGTNTGAGGGGAQPPTANVSTSAGGGGGGEYVELVLPAGVYTYTIGASGAGGIGTGTGAQTGGAGGTGFITVEEHYNYG